MSTTSDTTTTEPKAHNAKDILQEALDTIQATYWIQGDEFTFAYADYNADGPTWDSWNGVNKAILAGLGDGFDHDGLVNPEHDKAKVKGVCSIGALALANVTLYDEPLVRWEDISTRDIETWKAGAALVSAIFEGNTKVDWYDSDNLGSTIARWNDYHDRTREQIIEVFTKALEDPMLDATAPVEIYYKRPSGMHDHTLRVYFPDEAAAQAWIDGDSQLRTSFSELIGDDGAEFIIKPITHDALVSA